MKLFLDTADVDEIRTASSWGLLDGVTTNPSHIARAKRRFDDVLRDIFSIIDGPISVEAVSVDTEGLVREGRAIAAYHHNAVVKLPITLQGVAAVRILASEGIKTNVTLCFSPLQAYLAAKAGATYISPFVHRKDLVGEDGVLLIRQIRQIYDTYKYPTQILAASLRSAREVLDCLLAGADVATMPLEIMRSLYDNMLTDAGLTMFQEDWKSVTPQDLFTAATE